MRCFFKICLGCNIAMSLIVAITLLNAAPAIAADDAMMKRMEKIIQKQQEQIEAQAEAIKKLQEQVEMITERAPKVVEKLEREIDTGTETAVKQAKEAARTEVREISRHGDEVSHEFDDKLRLDLYGWINKAFMVSDDGDSTDYYVVDPGTASSRIGALGSFKVNDDLTAGTRLEFDYDHNRSSSVNQENKNNVGDGKFRDRWVDLQMSSKRFGKFFIGKGSTASDTTTESDLSGTSLALYSSLADSAGALIFFDKDTNALSDTQIQDVFTHLDGLGRDERIRYDTPKFWGFQLGGSVISGGGGDVALKYAAKWGENFKFAAAAAWSDPDEQDDSVDNRYSSSASILHSSGLSISLTGAMQELADNDRDDPTELYAKVGYRRKLFNFGESRFSVDYGYYEDFAQDGDEATAVGFAFVQDLPQWGSEYWLAYRWHELDRDNADFDDLSFFQTGWRLKF